MKSYDSWTTNVNHHQALAESQLILGQIGLEHKLFMPSIVIRMMSRNEKIAASSKITVANTCVVVFFIDR